MASLQFTLTVLLCLPFALMLLAMLASRRTTIGTAALWRYFTWLSALGLASTVLALLLPPGHQNLRPWVCQTPLGGSLAVLVQFLGTVIGAFSGRYLEGEGGQSRFAAELACVLAAVHLLLLADHWVVLMGAWALVGAALNPLLCFYPERPFALLASHKKRIADRLADVLLLAAAALAWGEVGSGALPDLWTHIGRTGMSTALQVSAALLVLAVILRTALLPVHGWLIQVMEAPTPVSALLHAGVVNLGGFVLIRFAPLLEQATPARGILIFFGIGTAVLAGWVMMTRISIKVRLAWSTVAQMGFMVLECGLGLYFLAALHLVGHSLYKAHAFLSASSVVRDTRLQFMRASAPSKPLSLLLAPPLAVAVVFLVQEVAYPTAWPWWWSLVMGLAWAPLLWQSSLKTGIRDVLLPAISGSLMIAGLTAAALLAHALPLGIEDMPKHSSGLVALAGLGTHYLFLVAIQIRPQSLRVWRRWSYAGFYVDEWFTRLALGLWPGQWTSPTPDTGAFVAPVAASDARA